ncbi:MAG: CDP-alcohol phosphatidyltransferase family protein [candidate division WOR-3 bacterium]
MKKLKIIFEKSIIPLLYLMNKLGIKPIHLTFSGLIFSLIPAFFYIKGNFLLAGILLIIFSLFDTLDGALARYRDSTTKFGAFIDSVTDRIQEGIIFSSLIYFYREEITKVLILFFSFLFSFLISYTRARAEGLSYSIRVGPMEREERIAFIAFSSLTGKKVFIYLLILFLILVVLTFLRRILYAYKIMEEK